MDLSAFRIPRPKGRLPRQVQPDAARMFYFAQLRPFLARMHALVTEAIIPLLPQRADAAEDERIKAALDRIALQIAHEMPEAKLREIAGEAFDRTSRLQRDQILKQVKATTGFDPLLTDRGLETLARQFIAQNVDLIRTVPERYFGDIRQVVEAGMRSGKRATEIAADLDDRYSVAESNTLLIANDQIGKAFGDVNAARQEELGVTRFVWRTANDQRVRDSHAELEGKSFDWSDPPEDAQSGEQVIPGQAINCRCYAEPDLSAFGL
jgi:SPP1 gp7 family putative phage head morphogenesis protein